MAEMIEKKALLDDLKEIKELLVSQGDPILASVLNHAIACVEKQPVLNAVEVVHGRWMPFRSGDWTSVFECSECHRRITVGCDKDIAEERVNKLYPFCNCGAKMDGGIDNEKNSKEIV